MLGRSSIGLLEQYSTAGQIFSHHAKRRAILRDDVFQTIALEPSAIFSMVRYLSARFGHDNGELEHAINPLLAPELHFLPSGLVPLSQHIKRSGIRRDGDESWFMRSHG